MQLNKEHALLALQLMDYTSLNDEDSESSISQFAEQAVTEFGKPSAICVYPQFIKTVKAKLLDKNVVPVVTVINFPSGNQSISQTLFETDDALTLGADEIDLVFPWQSLIAEAENNQSGENLITKVRAILPKHILLKVIIESGELKSEALIKLAANIAINSGADFVKTSTGKTATGATLSAAKFILEVCQDNNVNTGLKISGGIRDVKGVSEYFDLASKMMGEDYLTPKQFRIGASSLMADVLSILNNQFNQSSNKLSDQPY